MSAEPWVRREPAVATCHPDRPHRARNLCAACYNREHLLRHPKPRPVTYLAEVACPHCGARQSAVMDSRGTPDGRIRRRRQCVCRQRFTTYEAAG